MTTIKSLVFWQGAFSIHQSALLRNLADSHEITVTLVVWEGLQATDSEMGWSIPDYGQTRIVLRPIQEMQAELLARNPSTTAHVFSGTRGHPMIWNAFRQGLSLGSCTGIQSEAYRNTGIMAVVRLLRSRFDALQFAERVDFVLAIGNEGVDSFRRSGYHTKKIFPFAYFVETPSLCAGLSIGKDSSSSRYELVFVGWDSFRKGLDVLLHALQGVGSENWRLHIVGSPDNREKYAGLCAKLGLTDSVLFYGALPNVQAIDLISRSDLLVLPSRWDGWGAVVNEALMCGVPVVCSDKCGAADLIVVPELGEVVAAGSVTSLRAALGRRISRGKNDVSTKEWIRNWARCISGESAAEYLLQILDASFTGGNKPVPPWLS